MSYYDDRRVRAARERENRAFDQKAMTLSFEIPNPKFEMTDDDNEPEFVTLVLPARYEVCDTCGGKGSHVNPSIDAHGISGEEFAEDPDFHDSYLEGHYDVTCYGCGGARVVPVVDDERASKADLELYEEHAAEQTAYDAEEASEARYFAAFER